MQKHEWTQGIDFFAFDTLCSIRIMPYSRSAAAPILKDAWETAHLVEQTLNMFDETSELSCLCNNYAISFPFQASAMLYSFISDAANLSVMGYDPSIYLTGRSPLEAASIGIWHTM